MLPGFRGRALGVALGVAACVLASACAAAAPSAALRPAERSPAGSVTLTIIGTNDLHGHVLPDAQGRGGLALFASWLAAARRAHPVILVDAGDAFQGTLESNLNEGHAVIQAYNALGYDAMAVGNHEFDYGPVGPDVVPRHPGDDPRGALKARAAEARFPILAANIDDAETGAPVAWPNVRPATIVERAGVRVGIIGVATHDTPTSTMPANFAGLRLHPLADAIAREAARLRAAGCALVIVAAHAGAKCRSFDDPDAAARDCDDGEIFQAARQLEPGAVDVIVAGHTHAGVAHRVAGIAVAEAFAYGQAFDSVDVTVDLAARRTTAVRLQAPREIVTTGAIRPDAAMVALLQPYVDAARARKQEKLGVRVTGRIVKWYDVESPLGNLFVDLMRASRPGVEVALNNGGALRTDLDAGELSYGQVFEAYPFDNRFATVKMTGARLRQVIAGNLATAKGILSISGLRVRARCVEGRLAVELLREDGGAPVGDGERLTVVTSDFLASGGDGGTFGPVAPGEATIDESAIIREDIIAALRRRGGELSGADPRLYDRAHPRIEYPGTRPVTCR
jgi:2',3'-cyclic-nucleotide 2'-phosphodiesterase (5'-nucleotidase family)